MEDEPEFNDSFYEGNLEPANVIRLSHLNNKSSVLCPENQNITSQFLALQQLEAHQQMISRAKSTVDTSAPKSLQSYISVANRQRKKNWQKLHSDSRLPNAEGSNSFHLPTSPSHEEDHGSFNDSSRTKGIQTGIPFATFTTKTDDKIAWYLEALNKGEFQYPVDATMYRNESPQSREGLSSRRRVVKGDIMDWHKDSFVKAKKPFSPTILAHSSAKSKVKEMRCYNPPFRRKKGGSSHSSDTFESYDQEEESEDEDEEEPHKNSGSSSIEEETLVSRMQSGNNGTPHFRNSLPQSSRVGLESNNHSNILLPNEEDKYLSFLGKVTEDILGSGVYSDRAIQQAFEFHMQFYQEENKEKLQSLLNQVLDGLKISGDDPEDGPSHRNPLLTDFSRSDTPPEKDSIKEMSQIPIDLNLKSREEFNLGLLANNQGKNELTSFNQSTSIEESHTVSQDES